MDKNNNFSAQQSGAEANLKCMEYFDLISAYVDDELSHEEKTDLESHLRTCEHCSSILIAFRAVSTTINESTAPVPDSIRVNVMKTIKSTGIAPGTIKTKSPISIKTVMTRFIPVAACLVLILITIPYLVRSGSLSPLFTPASNSSSSSGAGGSMEMAMNMDAGSDSAGHDFDDDEVFTEDNEEYSIQYGIQNESDTMDDGASIVSSQDSDRYNGSVSTGAGSDTGSNADGPSAMVAPDDAFDAVNEESNESTMDSDRDMSSDVYFEGIYAVIMISGRLPVLLENYAPLNTSDNGDSYYEISRSDADALITEVSGNEGVLIMFHDDDGSYAQVYFSPGE